MKIFIQALDYDMWGIIVNGPYTLTNMVDGVFDPKSKNEQDDMDKKVAQINIKAINILYCSLDANGFCYKGFNLTLDHRKKQQLWACLAFILAHSSIGYFICETLYTGLSCGALTGQRCGRTIIFLFEQFSYNLEPTIYGEMPGPWIGKAGAELIPMDMVQLVIWWPHQNLRFLEMGKRIS